MRPAIDLLQLQCCYSRSQSELCKIMIQTWATTNCHQICSNNDYHFHCKVSELGTRVLSRFHQEIIKEEWNVQWYIQNPVKHPRLRFLRKYTFNRYYFPKKSLHSTFSRVLKRVSCSVSTLQFLKIEKNLIPKRSISPHPYALLLEMD